jgi:hypothetical protein
MQYSFTAVNDSGNTRVKPQTLITMSAMQNYILVSRTYADTTPESAMEGDFSEIGFITECEVLSFRELVYLLRDHPHPSESGEPSVHTWFTGESYVTDYRTGTDRQESVHFHRDNNAHVCRYWVLASKIAHHKRNLL